MNASTTFEEIIDASKNLSLELQRKHGIHVQILSRELIPQNVLQRLFSRPKVRVTGCIQNVGMQSPLQNTAPTSNTLSMHTGVTMKDRMENHVKNMDVLFKDKDQPEKGLEHGLLQRESYEGLMHLYTLLEKNDFSSSFLDMMKEYLAQNFTLQELKNVSIMNKAFSHILEKALVFYKRPADKQASQRIITLVGPTGTGKTTAISKLSVEFFVNKRGNTKATTDSVNLRIVSLDSFKVGAVDQIQKIADVLEVPCECIHELDDLRKYARKGARPEVLLVDTTGQNPREITNSDETQHMLSALKKRNEILLVVDASTSEKNLEYIFESFADYEYGGVVITKIDEAQSIGTVLSVCAKYKTPIAYLGSGQEPCKGLSLASVKTLRSFIHGL